MYGVCNLCGKQGHKGEDCWTNPSNANKRPSWWNKKEEIANAGADEGPRMEYSLMGIGSFCSEDFNGFGTTDGQEDEKVKENDDWTVPDDFFDKFDVENFSKTYLEEEEPEWLQEEEEVAYLEGEEPGWLQEEEEVALINENGIFPDDMKLLNDKNVWIIDTGASLSSTGNADGMKNLTSAGNSQTTMGNGGKLAAKAIGDIPVTIYDKHGVIQADSCLRQVQLLPGSPFNLLSGTWLLKNGYQLIGNKQAMVFTKGSFKLVCDIKIHTDKGLIYAVYLKRKEINVDEEAGAVGVRSIKSYTITEVHRMLGHCDEEASRAVAKQIGWHVTRGVMMPCESCARGKAKQKIVAMKESETHKATKPNERIYADMSSVKEIDGCKATYQNMWLMVDQFTEYKMVRSYKTKKDMVEPTCEELFKWKQMGKEVQFLRMDNAGENLKLEQRLRSKDWKLYPTIEYTARSTPQHNHKAEVAIATIVKRGRAMMIEANVPEEMRYVIQHKAMETAGKLDGLIMKNINGVIKSRVEHWSGKMPSYSKYLREWGEAGVVKTKTNTTPKLADRGVTCMLVGYADNHTGDCYEMLNWKTKRIMTTRDVLWLKRMYFGKFNGEIQKDKSSTVSQDDENTVETLVHAEEDNNENNSQDEGSEKEPGIEIEQNVNTDDNEEDDENNDTNDDENEEDSFDKAESPVKRITRYGREIRSPVRLIEEIEGLLIDKVKMNSIAREIVAVGAGIGGGFANTQELIPMKFKEAMAGPERNEWITAVAEEYQRMVKYKVFQEVERNKVPIGSKILSSTWAMKKKSNGVRRARINARGYEQVDGEHYDSANIASPVVNEASMFIILIIICMAKMETDVNDVRGAFLNGKFSKGESYTWKFQRDLNDFIQRMWSYYC